MTETMTEILETVPANTVAVGGTIVVLKESSPVNRMPPQLLTTMSSGLVLTAMHYMKQQCKSDSPIRLYTLAHAVATSSHTIDSYMSRVCVYDYMHTIHSYSYSIHIRFVLFAYILVHCKLNISAWKSTYI